MTISEGTNRLVGTEPADIIAGWNAIKAAGRTRRVPEYWDGQAARRIVDLLLRHAAVPLEGASRCT